MEKQIVFCRCNPIISGDSLSEKITGILKKVKTPVVELSDLCGICAFQKNVAVQLFSEEKETLLIACHPRAVNSLLRFAGIELPEKNLKIADFRTLAPDNLAERVTSFCPVGSTETEVSEIKSKEGWQSWFPVIDRNRCTGCGQCADFCLFGVYEKTAEGVKVAHPGSCKTNCPACARICPNTAIVFPKYQPDSAISGLDNFDEFAEAERRREDTETILGSDIYQALERRKAKRRRIISAETMEKANAERGQALAKFQAGKTGFIFNPDKLS